MPVTQVIIDDYIVRRFVTDYVENNCIEDTGFGSEQIDDLTELIMQHLGDPAGDGLSEIINDFLEGATCIDIQELHKRQGRYKREDWYHEGDGSCSKCSEHLLVENYPNGVPAKCPKCGDDITIWEGY